MSANAGTGFMVQFAKIQMTAKMYKMLASLGLIVWAVLQLAWIHWGLDDVEYEMFKCWIAARTPYVQHVNYSPPGGQRIIFDAQNFTLSIITSQTRQRKVGLTIFCPFLIGFCGTIIAGGRYYRKKDEEQQKPKWIRGSKLIGAKELADQMRKNKEDLGIEIGEVRMSKNSEQRHVFITGAAGGGKTQIISRVITYVRGIPGAKIICYGLKPDDYLCKHYDPSRGDILFSPIDGRGLKWNIWREIRPATAIFDIEAIAGSLIPTPGGAGVNSWVYDDARTVFAGVLTYLYSKNQRDMLSLWETLKLSAKELAVVFEGVQGCEAAMKLVANVKGAAADTIVSAMTEHTRIFQFMTRNNSDFSTATWLNDGKGGATFIQNSPEAKDLLRPILTLFIDMLSRRIISMPDSRANNPRKLFFLADEMGSLNRLVSVIDLITLGRSKGVSFWGGCQDLAQIDAKYGELRTSIINSCSTPIVLSCPDGVTAEAMSKLIGEAEFEETNTTLQGSPALFGDRTSQSKHKVTKRLVLPGTIQSLPPLTMYLRFPGYDWVKTTIQHIQYQNIAEAWVPNEDMKIQCDEPESKRF